MRCIVAQREHLPALTALWQTCFGDTREDVTAFYDALFDKITVFAAVEDGKSVSTLCALPAALVDAEGESRLTAYLYAVCTAPEQRGKGLCGALLVFAHKTLAAEGFSYAALVPSSEELFDFYRKFGYQTAFFNRTVSVPAQKTNAKIRRIDADAYRNLREMQLYGDFLDYDPALLSWQASVSEASGAGLYRIETADTVCCAAAEKRGETLCIKELLPDCPDAASALAAALRCKTAVYRTDGAERPFGMLRSLGREKLPEAAYLGLAFD